MGLVCLNAPFRRFFELIKAGVIVSQDETVFPVEQKKVGTYLGPWAFWNCVNMGFLALFC